ncbi:MAG: YdbL family protein [Pseudodesulfovibrio sp.]|nr:YdbL family protein [Pseudodesulfovibrio sp.]
MKNNKYILIIVTIAVCLIGATALAGGIKDRMRERVPAINSLKAQGVVGENNQGFLEFKGAQTQAQIVQAENNDRSAVYKAIAQKTGTTADLVGQRRATQIANQAPGGTWLQDAGGKWYRK